MLDGFILLPRHWLTLHGLTVAIGLLVYLMTSHVRRQRRHPSAAIAWLLSLVTLPYVALPLYLIFGSRKIARSSLDLSALHLVPVPPGSGAARRFSHLASALGMPAPVAFDGLAIHADGQAALEALRMVIRGARHSLDVATFLLGRDALGDEVIALLQERAQTGVRIRLLIDGVGYYMGGMPHLKPLKATGVEVALFVQPWKSALPARTNLRNHRKLVLADGTRLWSGGRNLAAEYFVGDARHHAGKACWADLSFDLSGAVAQQVGQQFERDWDFALTARSSAVEPPSSPAQPLQQRSAQLIASGPDQADDTLYSLLVSSLFSSHTRVMAITPYFVPDSTLLMAMTVAARRGVAVDLVLPEKSNHRLADLARQAALRDLVQAGARVWLTPYMLHAKAIVVDDDLALAGSANLDERSLFLNYEMMLAFYDPVEVERFVTWIDGHRQVCKRYQAKPPSVARELGEGVVRWLAFQL